MALKVSTVTRSDRPAAARRTVGASVDRSYRSCRQPLLQPLCAQPQQQQQESQPQQPQQPQQPAAQEPVAAPGTRSGPTGLNVKGKYRPTSPGGWAEMSNTLREAGLRMVAPQEVPWQKEKGAVVVDIRPAESYKEGHVPDSVNVPFYQQIQGWTPWQVARRVGYAFFGVSQGTEPNPNFIAEVRNLVTPETGSIIVYCNLGGSLEPTDINRNGTQTRSMVAAYELIQAGFKNVSVLKGGYSEWVNNGREVEVIE